MPTNQEFISKALTQKGDRYIFGTEVDLDNPNPAAFDCSELVQWTGGQLNVTPAIPDGAYYQWRHCTNRGRAVSVSEGLKTAGTLLFMGDGRGVGRDAITHVAISLGNGYTIEARGSKWGVGVWTADRGFDFAAQIPGVSYITRLSPSLAPTRSTLRTGMKGRDVAFAQACLNIIIPAMHEQGYGDGVPLKTDGVYGPKTGLAVEAFENFWNHKGPGQDKPLMADRIWTMAGTAPAVADMVRLLRRRRH